MKAIPESMQRCMNGEDRIYPLIMAQQSAWGAAATSVSSLENALYQRQIERLVWRLSVLQFPLILVNCKHFPSLNFAFINSFDCFPFNILLFMFILLVICGLLYCTSCFCLWTLWTTWSLMACLLTLALSYYTSDLLPDDTRLQYTSYCFKILLSLVSRVLLFL